MRVNRSVLSAFVVGIVGGALMAACQTYDFEPVEPLALAQTTVGTVVRAKAAKPNLMVLLDTSGSMTGPVDPSDPDCTQGGALCGTSTPCDVNRCPTRWSEMRSAMSSFLGTSGTVARMGLTTYPEAATNQCKESTAVKFAIPQVEDTDSTALQNAATQIANEILNRPVSGTGGPAGGTPTAASLKFVGTQQDLQTADRDDFILLLTDGLPNCSLNSGDPLTCTCTQANCGTSNSLACLDKDASVAAVKELLDQQEIRTIVIGFGADTATGIGPETLNAMAEAGGFPRKCDNDSACGPGDTCDLAKHLCGRRFYQAANQAELATALRDIINKVGSDVCLLQLSEEQIPKDQDGNPDKRMIVVYVDKVPVESGPDTWDLTPPGAPKSGVLFAGALCERIRSSTDKNQIELEVRALQRK